MNTIDLSQSAFTKLGENPVVFVFMTCMLCLYLTVLLWAYKADQRDIVKVSLLLYCIVLYCILYCIVFIYCQIIQGLQGLTMNV